MCPLFLALGRRRQEDLGFKASLGCTMRPYVKNKLKYKLNNNNKKMSKSFHEGDGSLCVHSSANTDALFTPTGAQTHAARPWLTDRRLLVMDAHSSW